MKPSLPVLREMTGAVGEVVRGLYSFLRDLLNRQHVWGNEVTVTFPGASSEVRVTHGLGHRPRGFWVVSSSSDVRVYTTSTPSTGTWLFLQASAAGTVTLLIY